jgi:hypothetical protein
MRKTEVMRRVHRYYINGGDQWTELAIGVISGQGPELTEKKEGERLKQTERWNLSYKCYSATRSGTEADREAERLSKNSDINQAVKKATRLRNDNPSVP